MTDRVFRLSTLEFFLLWQAVHREQHPVPLGTPHYGHTQQERARLVETTSRDLFARGLGTVQRPDEELYGVLRGLAEFEVGLEVVFTRGGDQARGLATAAWHGAFAGRVGEHVQVTGFRPTALAATTVGTLPPAPPGTGRSVNVRWDDYLEAGRAGEQDGTEGFLDVLRRAGLREPEANTLMRAVTTRRGGGQVGVIARNRNGYLHPTGDTVSWLDTADGRYLVRRDGTWLVVAPVDAQRLATAVEHLVAGAGRN
ncbi:ESX secretion-associated protein EspG [Saccharothrix variisporea]|uniref:ESAT-6 protein secretion system EspG family protein n=1 Tax=Saccharothrix variisporea TaxID=543527 RepID=A0A495XA33_9PSEU|nr:ESX secretion-associated protein EspG [Saccharothrix variisporea]RKT71341.1 ESAT-6 protein secretion system EspG family protein [Saccharothrix variisporea]